MYSTHYYFAYGSNMMVDQMRNRGVVYEKLPAKLIGYKLIFNKVSKKDPSVAFANIQEDENSEVEGILYELDNLAVQILDKAEGVPFHYEKTAVEVEIEGGRKIRAITYIANPKKVKEGILPTKDYLQKFLKNAGEYLSASYEEMLKKVKTHD